MTSTPSTKTCRVCGRIITPRRRWRDTFDAVAVCGERCRRQRLNATDAALERAIVELLEARGHGKTICPSEAARQVAPDGDAWRALMERVRSAARRLVAAGSLEITQGGKVVDPSRAKGPIRLRRR